MYRYQCKVHQLKKKLAVRSKG